MSFNILRTSKFSQENFKFDVFFCSQGYESRCTKVFTSLMDRVSSSYHITLKDDGSESYARSKKVYQAGGSNSIEPNLPIVASTVLEFFSTLHVEIERPINIGLDITSMPRAISATIIWNILLLERDFSNLSIFYNPAKFTPPSVKYGPVAYSGPVIPEYAGWSQYPDRPTSAIIGLGYELGRALGVIDYLDVDLKRVFILVPTGIDDRYDHAVKKTNKLLLEQVEPHQILEYSVDSPADTLIKLNSLVSGLLKTSRVTIIPFGPKILGAISVLTADSLGNDVTVWQVSGGDLEEPVDRKPTETIAELSIKLT